MPTEQEEQEVKELLKRVEIRTMRKDLLSLRETDALQERDKIANIKTIEEQLQTQRKQQTEKIKVVSEKAKIGQIHQTIKREEYEAKKDLKQYASEQERQQIFLLESQKFELQEKIKNSEKGKEPELELVKNNILLEMKKWQEKLELIVEQEKKLTNEEKIIIEKSQTTQVSPELRSLNQTKSHLDGRIQDIEKKRWQIEKNIKDLEEKVGSVNYQLSQANLEKNNFQNEIGKLEQSLREIYSSIIEREETKKVSLSKEQKIKQDEMEKIQAAQKEQIQRTQWKTVKGSKNTKEGFINEELQRKKFLEDIEKASQTNSHQQVRKSDVK